MSENNVLGNSLTERFDNNQLLAQRTPTIGFSPKDYMNQMAAEKAKNEASAKEFERSLKVTRDASGELTSISAGGTTLKRIGKDHFESSSGKDFHTPAIGAEGVALKGFGGDISFIGRNGKMTYARPDSGIGIMPDQFQQLLPVFDLNKNGKIDVVNGKGTVDEVLINRIADYDIIDRQNINRGIQGITPAYGYSAVACNVYKDTDGKPKLFGKSVLTGRNADFAISMAAYKEAIAAVSGDPNAIELSDMVQLNDDCTRFNSLSPERQSLLRGIKKVMDESNKINDRVGIGSYETWPQWLKDYAK
jgi:hypothetical protein